jgi:hypothetical protein
VLAALDMPFLLLPFRPASDPSAARNFVRNFFKSTYEGTRLFEGQSLQQELRLVEPPVRSIAPLERQTALILTNAGAVQHIEMVLEQSAGRRRDVGCL